MEKERNGNTSHTATEHIDDEKFMRRCIQLARCGEQGAPPNPMVGAVIVYDGRIIGEGYHIRCGDAHAEVNAINSIKEEDRKILSESTIYVSLEPCSHYGKTPPCAELLIRTGIKRVVIGCLDPFPRVSGRGAEMLCKAGIEVCIGILEKECRELNRRFITYHEKARPYITLKWAVSNDGYIDTWRNAPDGEVFSINQTSRKLALCHGEKAPNVNSTIAEPARLSTPGTQVSVHHLRAKHQAILVGHNTLLLDCPKLTLRYWAGYDPLKIVLGHVSEDELPAGWQAYSDLDTLIVNLHKQGVQSLLVEGGTHTLQTFIDAGLWDEAQEEISAKVLGSGVPAPKMPRGVEHTIDNRWGVYFNKWRNED